MSDKTLLAVMTLCSAAVALAAAKMHADSVVNWAMQMTTGFAGGVIALATGDRFRTPPPSAPAH